MAGICATCPFVSRPDIGPQLIGPGPAWNGVPGSGYALGAPVDPPRVKGKPTLRLLTAPYQAFDGHFILPFFADCEGGVRDVTIWAEGQSVTLERFEDVSYVKPDGSDGHWFGYAVRLDHAAFMAAHGSGAVDVYAVARPNRADFQPRVVGPFRFYPRAAAQRWGAEFTVGRGGSHASIAEALAEVRNLPVTEAAVITLLDGGDHPLGSSGKTSKAREAWTRLQLAPGKSGRLVREVPGGPYGSRPRLDGLEFGHGLDYDSRELLLYVESNWKAGVRFNGARAMLEGGRWSRGKHRRSVGLGSGSKPLYIENSLVDGVQGPLAGVTLATNSTFKDASADVFQNVGCAHNIKITGMSYGTLRDPQQQPGLSLAYRGAGKLELDIPGKTNSSARTATLYLDGKALGSLKFRNGSGEDDHSPMGELVEWLNRFAGVTAVLLDPDARAQGICLPTADNPLVSWSRVTITAEPLIFGWAADAHCDGFQGFSDANDGQVQIAFVTFDDCSAGQLYFVQGTAADITAGWIETRSTSKQPSQITFSSASVETQQHYIHDCSFPNDSFIVRTSVPIPETATWVIENSVMGKFGWYGGRSDTVSVRRVHAFAKGTSTAGAKVTETTFGGSLANALPGYDQSDFTPKAGGLLMNGDGSYRGSRALDGSWNVAA